MRRTWTQVREWARKLKRDVIALAFAARDPETPLAAKIVAATVAAYALSPIDLIPDWIPIVGYLDDLILVPLGVALALRLLPPAVLERARARAEEVVARPTSRAGLLMVLAIWSLVLAGFVRVLLARR